MACLLASVVLTQLPLQVVVHDTCRARIKKIWFALPLKRRSRDLITMFPRHFRTALILARSRCNNFELVQKNVICAANNN
jgi:hypothetical protein